MDNATRPTLTDNELLHNLRKGNESALRQIFELNHAAIVRYGKEIINDRPEAEEIALDSFYKLWQHRTEFNSLDHVKGFLYKTTRFACIDMLRQWQSRERQSEQLLERALNDSFSESRIVEEEVYQAIIAEINALPSKYATILKLRFLDDLDYSEIARRLGKSEAAIRKQKQRALDLLQSAVLKRPLLSSAALLILLKQIHA